MSGFFFNSRAISMARFGVYIDGFNVYHALNNHYRKYLWLNYHKLAESVIGNRDVISSVVYFSAFVSWKRNAVARHKNYIKALRSAGVEFVEGRFMRKQTRCHICGRGYTTHEEKQTDVNIAIRLLSDALEDVFDKALIISADSDLLPAMKAIHKHFPEKEVGVMSPIGRSSFELRKESDFIRKMSQSLLSNCQFEDVLQIGKAQIIRPQNWC